MSVYRSHHADNGRWHEIVGESGSADGEGCMMTAVKAAGWALVAGAVIGLTLLGTFLTAFRWDLW